MTGAISSRLGGVAERMENCVIVLNKPTGLGSNQALARIKRLLEESKMGFVGTLDPLATGVLPVFTGKATKLIAEFQGLPKTYRVTIKLGETTDTLDADGQVLQRTPLDGLDPERVSREILSRAGESEQTVPAFSAVKHQGVPAYRLARQGQPVPERSRTVRLWDIAVESIELPRAVFRVSCSAGTYMRSLAGEIGKALGVGAHVTALHRLACGALFTEANSFTLERIADAVLRGDWSFCRNPAEFLTEFHSLTVGEEGEQLLREGRSLPLEALLDAEPRQGRTWPGVDEPSKAVAMGPGGNVLAIGEITSDRERLAFRPRKVLI